MMHERYVLESIPAWANSSASPDGSSGGCLLTVKGSTETKGVTAEQQKQIKEAMKPSDANTYKAARAWHKHGGYMLTDEGRSGWPLAPEQYAIRLEQAPCLVDGNTARPQSQAGVA